MATEPNHIAARIGVVAVFVNVLAFVPFALVDDSYRPDLIERWSFAVETRAVPVSVGAWLFSTGALLLVPWAAGLTRSLGPYAWPGGAVLVVGAVVRMIGSLLPLVAARFVPHGELPIVTTLLGLTLVLEALFHLCLGSGVLLVSLAMARHPDVPMWMPASGLLTGLLALPVAGMVSSAPAAIFMPVADFIFLGWASLTCLYLVGAWVPRARTHPTRVALPPVQPQPGNEPERHGAKARRLVHPVETSTGSQVHQTSARASGTVQP